MVGVIASSPANLIRGTCLGTKFSTLSYYSIRHCHLNFRLL